MIAKTNKLILIFIIILKLITSVFADDNGKEKKNLKVILLDFDPYQFQKDTLIESQIQSSIKEILQSKNIDFYDSKDRLEQALAKNKNETGGFLIHGYYKRENSLVVYGHIYNLKTGYLIDAYNSNQFDSVEGIKLDPEEMKEEDSDVVSKFAKKILISIQSNPNQKERTEKLNDYVTSNPISKDIKFKMKEEDASASAEVVFDLLKDQVTTSSTKIARKTNEAPTIVSVISQQDMVDYGRTSINDIMYQLPGFAPSQDYDRRTVSSRGMFESWDNSHYMFLMDGVQFNDNLSGSAYTWEVTPLNMIKSLEVIRGPGSALYGSNSINGVINMNTYSGSDLNGQIKTRVRTGDNGTRILDVMTGNTNKYLSYVVSYNSFKTDGNNYKNYDLSGRTDAFGLLDKFQINDQRKNNYFLTKLEGEGAFKGLSLQYHHQEWNFQTGHGWLFQIPDRKDSMNESRDLVTLKYKTNITKNLVQEYVARYQIHYLDWDANLLPINSQSADFPNGVNEKVKNNGQDLLSRAQYTYSLNENGASILAGMENTRFLYKGDQFHYSNFDLSPYNNSSYPPENWMLPYNVNSTPFRQGNMLDWIKNKPVMKYGFFSQFVSGKLFSNTTEITVGIRHDEIVQNFIGVDKPYKNIPDMAPDAFDPQSADIVRAYKPNEHRTLKTTNPRVGLVFSATKTLNIKLMAGTAFREPSITNQFPADTYVFASQNPRTIKPEKIRTYEIGLDWVANKNLNLRTNAYQLKFENQIAYATYGTAAATTANLYDLTTRGVEFEALFAFSQNISGFANYSYSQRINEKIQDKGVSQSPNMTTWYPIHTANFGIKGNYRLFNASLSIKQQGTVFRRLSDTGYVDNNNELGYPVILPNLDPSLTNNLFYRTKAIPQWYSVNTRFVYKIAEDFTIGFIINNLLNSHQMLVKPYNAPFDYVMEGRTFYFDLNLTL